MDQMVEGMSLVMCTLGRYFQVKEWESFCKLDVGRHKMSRVWELACAAVPTCDQKLSYSSDIAWWCKIELHFWGKPGMWMNLAMQPAWWTPVVIQFFVDMILYV